jgi:hypothetical protein
MADPIVWLGGWASNLACWRGDLEALFPGREHTFLDSHAVLSEPGLLPLAAATLPAGGTLIAWSLGSLLLHRALAAGDLRPACRLISACPIFDFCREGGPWPLAALSRMARRLPKSREAVLDGFWTQVKGNSPVTLAQSEVWMAQSRTYPLDSLLEGLDALGSIRVAREHLPAHPRHSFLASARDPLAPPARDAFPGPGWTGYPQGHLPFLEFPDALRALLGGRSLMGHA